MEFFQCFKGNFAGKTHDFSGFLVAFCLMWRYNEFNRELFRRGAGEGDPG